MTQLDGKSKNIINDNIEKLKELFPEVFSEGKIDFDKLQSELGNFIDPKDERYNFTWNGKSEAKKIALTPSSGTLRPAKAESKNWDTTQNLYIEGDNLEVLKLLQKSYHKKVKMIYIDPPYNTGRDILYKNDFSNTLKTYLDFTNQVDKNGNILTSNPETSGRYHSDWLNMMYPRLKLARNLLNNDGVITIAIDHYELSNIINVANEIFGEINQLGIIAVVHKPEGRNQAKFFGTSHEYMLFYAKNKTLCNFRKVILNTSLAEQYEFNDENGSYKLKNFIRMSDGKYSLRENKPTFWYPIYVSSDLSKLSTKAFDNSVLVYPITENGQERTWKTTIETCKERIDNGTLLAQKNNNTIVIYEKLYEDQVVKTHWIDKKYHAYHFGTKVVDGLLESKTFDFPKSVDLVIDTIKLITADDDLILDFFSGSATTAHAVMKLNSEDGGNRKFICVQLPETIDEKSESYKAGYKNICEIGKERIKRAGEKILNQVQNDNARHSVLDTESQKTLDIGFKVFKLDSSNIKTWDSDFDNLQSALENSVDNIKSDRSSEDLLYEILLKYGLDLTLPIEEIEINGKKVFSIGFGALVCCLDSDIDIDTVEKIAGLKKQFSKDKGSENMRVVFRDGSFEDSVVKTNALAILKQHGIDEVVSV